MNDSKIELTEKCPNCGGNVSWDWVTDHYKQRVCDDCGKVVFEENTILEEQESEGQDYGVTEEL